MREMQMIVTWAVALALTASLVVDAAGQPTASVRAIPIPMREHGYSNFDSTVISSQDELVAFLTTASQAQGMRWNNRKNFEEAISRARLDFSKERLVLLRHTEGSGSVQIGFGDPLVKGKKVICEITRKEPEMGTADMAYYSFALAVDKVNITEVELRVAGRQPILLSLKDDTKTNKPDAGSLNNNKKGEHSWR